VPELSAVEPTAIHQAGPVHESAASAPFATLAFGVGCTDHVARARAAAAAAAGAVTCPVSATAATRMIAARCRAEYRKETMADHPVSPTEQKGAQRDWQTRPPLPSPAASPAERARSDCVRLNTAAFEIE